MTFFNKKTEVMKVELTPFGRYKLSIGKLKPFYYRFFDNNVIYDTSAMGTNSSGVLLSEDQNDADHRIRQETPILKQNPNVTGVQTMKHEIETDLLHVQTVTSKFNANTERYYNVDYDELYSTNERKNKKDDHINQLIYNLGTLESNAVQSPSYQVDAFRGKLAETTSKFYHSENIQTSSIPQIDLEINYEYYVSYAANQDYYSNMDLEVIGPFDDGSNLIIKKQDPLLRIKETNAFDEKENFHITAYKVEEQVVGGKPAVGFIKTNLISSTYLSSLDSAEYSVAINDGTTTKVFQFLSSAAPVGSNIGIYFTASSDTLGVSKNYRDALLKAVNLSGLNVVATEGMLDDLVDIKHLLIGSQYNIPFTYKPNDVPFCKSSICGLDGGFNFRKKLLYHKMDFEKRNNLIMNDMYVGEVEQQELIDPETTDIPYFFDVLVDKEIAESDYCATVGEIQIRNIYLDEEVICPDLEGEVGPINIYSTNVNPDDLEDCD